ncbi:AAA family ATPase [Desulfuromonas sp. CSMB_57]|uniref:AAA family ATPase n=1 Tax=Desulfuromonas sp. CSMB_57 TaxID=2807629 RepID=UPI001CD7D178|nr:AAA family ATPase [Desulfuromonas sp. CSMB_57]
MILERLVLENFRQFKGRQEIVFSDLRERNVTIVHAENGFGKTTLLKALLWGLYGREGLMGNDGNPDDFERPDSIIHEGLALRAKDPMALAATVEITFKHDADRYVLTRQLSLAQQKLNPKQTTLSLEVMKNGQTFSLDRPQQRIQAIVPDGISRFLFFNGERINYLAMERNSAQVTEAIHQMLGLDLLKQTIDDLRHQNVRGKLRSEQKEMTSDEKRNLIEELSRLEEQLREYKTQEDQTLANLKAIQVEITTVDSKLAANRVAHELQAKRIHLSQEREELVSKKDDVTKRISKLIADDGYTLFTSPLINRGREIVAKFRSEGKIPARVLNTFLQELLDHDTCICTRSLIHGTPERAAVEKLLTIAGDQDFNNAVGALDHAIGLIEGISDQTQDLLNQLKIERLGYSRDIRERDEEIEEIHQKLGGKNDEEVSQLESKRKSLSLDRDAQNAALGRIGEQLKISSEAIETLENQIRQIEDKEEAAARAQRRVDAVEDCVDILDKILKAETEELRPLLNAEIDSHFRKIMTKDYWAELTDNYTLRIRKRVAGGDGSADPVEIDAALSTGERTVTSLVFIASLVALANRRSEIPTILRGLAGSAFPVAIDSPFGSLSIFREGVARYVPELAPQVVLFVSPKQYDGEVEAALKASGRISKRYYLRYYGPSMPERAAPELIVDGQKIQQYFPLDNDEFTELVPL